MRDMTSDEQDSLINKIVTQAGIVNHAILSDRETQQGKAILRDEERILSELDLEIQALIAKRDGQQDKVAKFRVALAPHKRIPHEILLQIFIHCMSSANSDSGSPQAPWEIRQVCSLWRHISGHEHRLWQPTTMLDLDKADSLQDRTDLSDLLSISPPAVVISANFSGRGDVNALRSVLVPNLWRIQELTLRLRIDMYDELWRIVLPYYFASLRAAEFFIDGEDQAREYWGSRWDGAEPFQLARSLKTLKLTSPESFASTFLSLDIPWSQLTSLDIVGLENLGLTTTFQILHKCSSLEILFVKFKHPDTQVPPTGPLYMPMLRSLVIQNSVPSALADRNSVWNNLSVLDLSEVEFQDGRALYIILKQCTSLTQLSTQVPPKAITNTTDGPLSLPHLISLSLRPVHDTWILRFLITPALTSFYAHFDNAQPDLPLLRSMLVSSGCTLSVMCLIYLGPKTVDSTGLRELLTTIHTAVNITCLRIFNEDDVLQDIGQGTLLPRLQSFCGWPASLEAICDMVETRVEREFQSGCLTLRQLHVGCPQNSNRHSRVSHGSAMRRLEALMKRYGIKCSIDKFPG